MYWKWSSWNSQIHQFDVSSMPQVTTRCSWCRVGPPCSSVPSRWICSARRARLITWWPANGVRRPIRTGPLTCWHTVWHNWLFILRGRPRNRRILYILIFDGISRWNFQVEHVCVAILWLAKSSLLEPVNCLQGVQQIWHWPVGLQH